MEILLLEDVNGVGKKNDLLVVGDGFALNCLLPQRKALVATPTVRKRYADHIRKRAEEKEHERSMQQQAASALMGKSLTFSRKASKTGKLYASITEKMIADALAEQHSLNVPESAIQMSEHIKTVGTHQVVIQIGSQSQTITVVAKEETK